MNGEIAAALAGKAFDQGSLDRALIDLDGTPNKGRLGANATLAVSMAALRAAAAESRPAALSSTSARCATRSPAATRDGAAGADDEHPQRRRPRRHQRRLPGVHGDAVRRGLVREALRIGAEIFHALRGILKKRGLSTGVGDEGGFAPNLKSNREAVDVVLEAVDEGGLRGRQGRLRRARRRRQRVLRRGVEAVRLQEVGRHVAHARRDGGALRRVDARVPDHLDRGRPLRGRLAGLEDADHRPSAIACSSSATMCSSPTRRS